MSVKLHESILLSELPVGHKDTPGHTIHGSTKHQAAKSTSHCVTWKSNESWIPINVPLMDCWLWPRGVFSFQWKILYICLFVELLNFVKLAVNLLSFEQFFSAFLLIFSKSRILKKKKAKTQSQTGKTNKTPKPPNKQNIKPNNKKKKQNQPTKKTPHIKLLNKK